MAANPIADDRYDAVALRAREGDTAALDELLVLIDAEGLAGVAVRRVLLNQQAVADVCQDVLVVVAESIGKWDGRGRFTTWLWSVARNKAVDHLRRTRPTSELPDVIVSDQDRISSLIATRVSVNDAVEALPDRYRDPVVLRDVEQRDYAEIAELLDLPPATVRTRVSRGRAMVAARYATTPQ